MNTNTVLAIVIGVLNLCPVRSADATVEVTYYNTVGTQLNTVPFSNGVPVSVSLNANIGSVKVVANPTSGDIGRITISGTADDPVNLFVTSNLDAGTSPPTTTGARDLGGVTDNTGLIRFKGRLSGDLTGDVDVPFLVYLIVGDEIQQPIHSSSDDFRVEAGRVGVGGDMTMDQDEIALVRVTTGDLLGDVKALDGSITTIEVLAGDIGSATNYVTIQASAASLSGYHIQTLHADRHMYANIDCNTSTPTTVDGNINIFQVGNISSPSTTGDFHGSLKLGTFAFEHMYVGRDLYATIDIGSDFPPGTPTMPKRLLIGRSFKSGAQVNVPATGLHGFIMISRMLSGQGSWESGATVNVGSTTLTNSNYSTLATSLGRGAAGLTPYRLHNQSSTPANGATEVVQGSSLASVRLRHYGPLAWNSANGVPANVSRQPICTTGSYGTVTTTTSNFALADDNPSADEAPCNLVVTLAFEAGYQYKITPTGALRCFGGDNIAVQWDSDYIINVRSQCFADMNASGRVDIDDLLSVINLWGACPSPPAECEADVMPNPCGGGTVDIDDLLIIVNNWGLLCPTFTFEDVGSLSSVQDCMDAATNEAGLEPFSAEWDDFVNKCVDGLCQAQIIVCD